jgi:hypothetical protein
LAWKQCLRRVHAIQCEAPIVDKTGIEGKYSIFDLGSNQRRRHLTFAKTAYVSKRLILPADGSTVVGSC